MPAGPGRSRASRVEPAAQPSRRPDTAAARTPRRMRELPGPRPDRRRAARPGPGDPANAGRDARRPDPRGPGGRAVRGLERCAGGRWPRSREWPTRRGRWARPTSPDRLPAPPPPTNWPTSGGLQRPSGPAGRGVRARAALRRRSVASTAHAARRRDRSGRSGPAPRAFARANIAGCWIPCWRKPDGCAGSSKHCCSWPARRPTRGSRAWNGSNSRRGPRAARAAGAIIPARPTSPSSPPTTIAGGPPGSVRRIARHPAR